MDINPLHLDHTSRLAISEWATNTVNLIEQDLVEGAFDDLARETNVDAWDHWMGSNGISDAGIALERMMVHELVTELVGRYNLRHIDPRLADL